MKNVQLVWCLSTLRSCFMNVQQKGHFHAALIILKIITNFVYLHFKTTLQTFIENILSLGKKPCLFPDSFGLSRRKSLSLSGSLGENPFSFGLSQRISEKPHIHTKSLRTPEHLHHSARLEQLNCCLLPLQLPARLEQLLMLVAIDASQIGAS